LPLLASARLRRTSKSDDDIIAALKAGAKGYVLKGVASAALVEIVEGIARGESFVSPALAARILSEMSARSPAPGKTADTLSTLTQREEEILRLVAVGLSNKEVGQKLDLQEKTVKHHMTRIMGKLHVRNRTEAAVLLREATARRP
jgi:two-component system, NarL family, nitrate/nitrite response regulator NarL